VWRGELLRFVRMKRSHTEALGHGDAGESDREDYRGLCGTQEQLLTYLGLSGREAGVPIDTAAKPG